MADRPTMVITNRNGQVFPSKSNIAENKRIAAFIEQYSIATFIHFFIVATTYQSFNQPNEFSELF